MRLGPDTYWCPSPGRLVDFVPAPSTMQAAESAPEHPLGPSLLQGDHISGVLAQRAAGREHRGYTCSAITVDADLDEDRMAAALTAFVRAHEGLRSSFRVDEAAGITRYVVDPEAIDIVAAEVTETDPHRHLAQRLPHTAVFDAFPGCAFGVVTRPGSFDLYYGIDHAYGDGSSQVLGLLEILARYRGEQNHPLVSARHGSYLDYAVEEFTRATALTPDSPGVVEWRRVLTESGGTIPVFPLPLGLGDDPQQVVIHCEDLADAATTEALSVIAKAHGTSLISVIYAGLALAHKALSGAGRYATATVLSTRGNAEHRGSQGWYCNFAPVGFEIRGSTVEEVIDDAAAAVEASKRAVADPVHGALAILLGEGAIDPSVVASPQMVTYFDFRWFPAPEGARDIVVFTGEGRTRNASLWISRDLDGLRINTQRPDNPVAAESVVRYFATVRDILTAAVAVDAGAR
ncbi:MULTISPECIES: condensation domain-containing protein [unclassified Gordonia (in: high G+C Gram-positive bacteria)]